MEQRQRQKQRPAQSSAKRPAQSSAQRQVQSGVQRPMQGGAQRSVQSSAQRPVQRSEQSSMQRPVQRQVQRPTQRQRQRRKNTVGFDYSLLFLIVFLLGFGLVMIYSTSSYNAQLKFDDSEFYFKKQLMAVGLGSVVMFVAYKFDYHWLRKLSLPVYVLSLLMIILVIPFGYAANGAKRWINIGPLSFQPAEFAKLALIIAIASLVCRLGKNMNKKRSLIIIWLAAGIPAFMIMVITSNMSSAIIILGIGFVMSFVSYPGNRIFPSIFGIGFAAATGAWLWLKSAAGYAWFLAYANSSSSGFRAGRIVTWLDPEQYAEGKGFQTVQALYAIGSGNLFGKGLGKSLQKLGFIPEAQNDMIFSVICEELGIFGAFCIIIVFTLMLWRFINIANHSDDLLGSLLTMGVFAHIAIQVVFNIGVVTNIIPNTGISLPFISYGGTSVMFLMAEMGIVLNISAKQNVQ